MGFACPAVLDPDTASELLEDGRFTVRVSQGLASPFMSAFAFGLVLVLVLELAVMVILASMDIENSALELTCIYLSRNLHLHLHWHWHRTLDAYWLGNYQNPQARTVLVSILRVEKLNNHTGVEGYGFMAWFGQYTDIASLVSLFGFTIPAYIFALTIYVLGLFVPLQPQSVVNHDDIIPRASLRNLRFGQVCMSSFGPCCSS